MIEDIDETMEGVEEEIREAVGFISPRLVKVDSSDAR